MISVRSFKQKTATVLLPSTAVVSVLISLCMTGPGPPSVFERILFTFLFPVWTLGVITFAYPLFLIPITVLVAIFMIAGIRLSSRALFLFAILTGSSSWLFLVWLSWLFYYEA